MFRDSTYCASRWTERLSLESIVMWVSYELAIAVNMLCEFIDVSHCRRPVQRLKAIGHHDQAIGSGSIGHWTEIA